MFLRVVDLESGSLAGAVDVRRTGLAYERLLRRGRIDDPVTLSLRVAREVIEILGA